VTTMPQKMQFKASVPPNIPKLQQNRRTILITGCSSGIGLCCAHGMRARGWQVAATARKPPDLDRLRKEGLAAFYLDYADSDSIRRCVDQVLEQTGGGLYALFNNGAFAQPGAVEDLAPNVLRAQFETNLFGWHDLTCRVIPTMRANGSGRIVQCSSVLGLVAMPFRGAYVAAKFALEGLSDVLRHELAGSGIFVSLIEPGPIRSRLVEHAMEAFKRNIDIENSVHSEAYKRRIEFFKERGSHRFKLGPEAVLKRLVHAVESSRPKPHYYLTVPAYFAVLCRRLLPNRVLDRIMERQ